MMTTLLRVNLLLLVMGILGNLGAALKTGAKADQDDDGDDGNDENTGSAEEATAPDSGSSSSGADGSLDLAGLQNSLKEGGVDGLSSMLKSMAATMNTGSTNGAKMHITTDADGHEMYDFRDLAASSTPTPAHADGAQPLPPPLTAPKATLPAENREAEAQSTQRTAVSSTDEKSEGVSPAEDVPPPKLSRTVVLPLHATPKEMPLPSIRKAHKRKKHAKLPSADASQRHGSIARVVLERPMQLPKSDTSAVTERPAVPQVTEPEVSKPATQPLPPPSAPTSSAATGGSIAKLSSGLDEVRRSVDKLLTLTLQKQNEAPLADQKRPVAELSSQDQQISERVGALERENSKLERMFQVQAGRLEAIESQQQDEERELGQVLHENVRLRTQLYQTKRGKMRKRAGRSNKMLKKPAKHHIQTYYHRRKDNKGQMH